MKGICQVCGEKVDVTPCNRKQDLFLDDAAIHSGEELLVVKEHDDPHGRRCNGSLAIPEKIVYD